MMLRVFMLGVLLLGALPFAVAEETAEDWIASLRGAKQALERGDFSSAAELCEQSLSMIDTQYGANHPNRASVLGTLGRVLIENEDYDKAEAALLEAMVLVRRGYGEDSNEAAKALLNLGALHQVQGKAKEGSEKAVTYYREAESILRRKEDTESKELLSQVYSNLVSALGESEETDSVINEAERLNRDLGEEGQRRLADLYHRRALSLAKGESNALAGEYFQRALARYQDIQQENGDEALHLRENLAENLRAQGKLEQSEYQLKKLLDVYRKKKTPERTAEAERGVKKRLLRVYRAMPEREEEVESLEMELYGKRLEPEEPKTEVGSEP